MSGIAGWVDFRRSLAPEEAVFRKMVDTLTHRGPDHGGVWLSDQAAIGHRKLATGGSGQGTQPAVTDAGGPVVLAYDGHVDNIDDLRRDLQGSTRLKARTETEVLLEAFLRWGEAAVARIHGMFALCLWDSRTRRLLLARDRLGVKPLYYFEYPGGVLFASEPKGIFANPRFVPRLDPSALPILLQPRLTLPGETPLRGLREVAPAHLVTVTEGGVSEGRFWRLVSEPHRESFEDTARHVRTLLEDAVKRQLAGDEPHGAMLSGGLDSTSVAALAAKTLRDAKASEALRTYCIGFDSDAPHFVATELRPDVDAPYAAKAAAFMGTSHTTIMARTQDLLDLVPATRKARDLPAWGQFDASMLFLFGAMSRECTHGLTGEAADEIFGGYPYLFKPEVVSRDRFPWLGDGPRLSDYLSGALKARVDPRDDERARYQRLLADVPALPGEAAHDARMREVLYLGMAGPLAVVLDRKDRMSTWHGIEMRVPFCDHRVVQYVWNVPWSMKAERGLKGLLKAAMGDLVPSSTLDRKKSAYPHVHSPEYDQELVRQARAIVTDPNSPVAEIFDARRLTAFIAEVSAHSAAATPFPGGGHPAHMLIHLIEVNAWIRDHGVSMG